ncbi:hypothetical protein [Aurantiacibacter aquimixticola]|uniref:Uncharacterized protein n=1 Tax=Aurantiacibacter aquimixticola TaxID=1958945 RepID=A0A419RUP0_9SPHN|nr:hypothetical protein [Aurantiacibacter aquimixticola]RJY09464.1 hypothetical protein D6201_08935 [Aurantiacibacter aquimixticola]
MVDRLDRSALFDGMQDMFVTTSPLSLVAIALYAGVAACAAGAAWTAITERQMRWHFRFWCIIAIIFTLLILLRAYGFEEATRDTLRTYLKASDLYASRRVFQRPAAAFLVISIAGAGILAVRYLAVRNSGRRDVLVSVSLTCSVLSLALLLLRILSLHSIDFLLYGPLKLNWVFDIGSSVLAAGSALAYIRRVRGRIAAAHGNHSKTRPTTKGGQYE